MRHDLSYFIGVSEPWLLQIRMSFEEFWTRFGGYKCSGRCTNVSILVKYTWPQKSLPLFNFFPTDMPCERSYFWAMRSACQLCHISTFFWDCPKRWKCWFSVNLWHKVWEQNVGIIWSSIWGAIPLRCDFLWHRWVHTALILQACLPASVKVAAQIITNETQIHSNFATVCHLEFLSQLQLTAFTVTVDSCQIVILQGISSLLLIKCEHCLDCSQICMEFTVPDATSMQFKLVVAPKESLSDIL